MDLISQIKRFHENREQLSQPFSYYLSLAVHNYLNNQKDFSDSDLAVALYGVFNILLLSGD